MSAAQHVPQHATSSSHDIFVATCGYASNEYTNPSEKTNFA